MEYANVSVKFPRELDAEIERFLEETGIYTNKSEFVKEACRRHLEHLQNETAVAALRTEQLLARAEQNPATTEELQDRLDTLRKRVDEEDVKDAVEAARAETSDELQS
jgi:Arc/MetJ-type ribon-helix-helix transcriptional regulator